MKFLKWIGGIIGFLILLIVLVYIVGMLIPESHTASVSHNYTTTKDQLWETIIDYENYASWRSDVDKVELIDSLTWREYYSYGEVLTFKQVEMDSLNFLKTKIADENIPFGGSWEITLQNSEKGNIHLKIVENGKVYDPFFRFINTFFMDQKATMNTFVTDLQNKLDD